MFRNIIISVIAVCVIYGCATTEYLPEERQGNVRNDIIEGTMEGAASGAAEALVWVTLPVTVPVLLIYALTRERGDEKSCTVYYCTQKQCGSVAIFLDDSGKPDGKIEEVLKDTIPEKTHHDCPVESLQSH